MIKLLDSENSDYDLTSLTTVLTHTPSVASPMRCQVLLKIGDGSKDLDGSGGAFDIGITVGGVKVEPYPEAVYFATRDSGDSARLAWWSQEFPVVANDAVTVTLMSPNAADTDVDVVAYLYDVNAVDVIAVSGDTTVADNLETACDGGAYNLGGGSIVAASVTAEVTADVTKVSGDATAANNLELMYDGTGYTDTTAPASRSQLSNLAVTGSAVNTVATGAIIGTGTQASGTYVSTAANDGTRHVITDVGNALEMYYEFSVGSDGVPTGVVIDGYLTGVNDTLTVYGYDWTTGWIAIGSYVGSALTGDVSRTYPLFTGMVGTGDDLGKVRVRFYAASGLSTASLNIDQIYVQYSVVNRSVGYQDGSIWIDTNSGTAGTTSWINGTADNPVNSIANAYTLATALGLNSFVLLPGSEITLTASASKSSFRGRAIIHLGGQNIADASFRDAYTIDGVSIGDDAIFINCGIGDITAYHGYYIDCLLKGEFTSVAGEDYLFSGCDDGAIGAGANVEFTFAANVDVVFRSWTGGLQLNSMASTNTTIVDGAGRIIIDASSVGGSITIRGFFPYSTGGDDFVAAGGTLIDDQAYSEGLIADAVWDESITAHGDSGTTGDALATVDSGDGGLSAAEVNAACDEAIFDAALATSAELATHDSKLDTVDGNVDLVLEDTDELQGNQGNWLTATGFATSGALSTHDGKLDTVDGNVDLILEDTTELQGNQGNWLTATGFATAIALSSHDAKIDTAQGTLTKIEGMLVLDGVVYKYTANALEESTSGAATLANQALILGDIVDMKGTGFEKDTNSLVNLAAKTPINVTVETTVVE